MTVFQIRSSWEMHVSIGQTAASTFTMTGRIIVKRAHKIVHGALQKTLALPVSKI